MARENIIVGLDIGTTKIGCIIAELDGDLNAKIVGVGTSRSEGLRRGVVVNLEKTVVSIGRAIDEAELMAGVEVRNVFAGIAGDHIRSINSHGVIAVSRGGVEITRSDINRVIDAAKAVAIPMDREILHILPQEFIVDEQQGIKDPTGMAGRVDARRERPRSRAGRHRWRDDGYRSLQRGIDPPHFRDRVGREQRHERHRDRVENPRA
jgi:cell division protein FtsA